MAVARVESQRFPYLPLIITVGERTIQIEALLDTGFDGDVAIPRPPFADQQPRDEYRTWALADGSIVATPVYHGMVELGSFVAVAVDIIVLGDEPIMGRGISDRYRMILDHGTQLVVEP